MTRAKLRKPNQYDRSYHTHKYDQPAPELGIRALFAPEAFGAPHQVQPEARSRATQGRARQAMLCGVTVSHRVDD